MANYTKLPSNASDFNEMMDGFGVVTVMNAKIFKADVLDGYIDDQAQGVDAIHNALVADTTHLLAEIDSLKIANITIEGPSKTVMGGRYSNPLIKFGKSARIEMQDALGRGDALEAFGGCVNEYDTADDNYKVMHITEDFAAPVTIMGESFFISRKTGKQVKVDIILYKVLPDSIFNLTQDAEGDATVFDLNGDLLTTEILLPGDKEGTTEGGAHGVFYSIVPHGKKEDIEVVPVVKAGKVEEAKTKYAKGSKFASDAKLETATGPAA